MLRGGQEGLVWGFVGGLCLDVLSGGPLGASAIALMVVGLLSGQGETNIFRGNILLPMFVAPLGTLVYYGLLLVILELAGRSLPVLPTFSQVILPAAIVNMIAMPFVYVFMRWLNRKVERRAMYW